MKINVPEYGQHMCFLGMTGCGKSQFAQNLVGKYERYFLFDTQDSLYLKGKKVKIPLDAIRSIKKNDDKIKYTPKIKYHDREINNLILEFLLDSSTNRKKYPRIIYIDEIFHLGYNQSFPTYLPVAFAVGRQRGLTMAVSTQRPKLIPTNILTECSHLFVFKLNKESDMKFVTSFIENEPDLFYKTLRGMKLEEHKFIYINMRSGEWRLCNPIALTEQGREGFFSEWKQWIF